MDNLDDLAAVFGPMVYRLTNAPEAVSTLFFYVMAWLMVSDGEASFVSSELYAGATYLHFRSQSGAAFTVRKPVLTAAEEQVLQSELPALKLLAEL